MAKNEELKEEPIHSREIYNGKLLHAFSDEVRLPDGSFSTREWIKHPGAAAVLPVFDDGSVMLLKQFRYPVGKVFNEVPAGKIDANEEVQQTAVRELGEETGLVCKNIHYLAPYYPAIGYSNEIIHLYCAWNLE
jgi:ADP-ribose pyrophosphatase